MCNISDDDEDDGHSYHHHYHTLMGTICTHICSSIIVVVGVINFKLIFITLYLWQYEIWVGIL